MEDRDVAAVVSTFECIFLLTALAHFGQLCGIVLDIAFSVDSRMMPFGSSEMLFLVEITRSQFFQDVLTVCAIVAVHLQASIMSSRLFSLSRIMCSNSERSAVLSANMRSYVIRI